MRLCSLLLVPVTATLSLPEANSTTEAPASGSLSDVTTVPCKVWAEAAEVIIRKREREKAALIAMCRGFGRGQAVIIMDKIYVIVCLPILRYFHGCAV